MFKLTQKLAILLLAAFSLSIAIAVPSSAATGSENKWVKIINQRSSGFPIWAVYITPAGDDNWEQDQLNGETIEAGRTYRWTIPWDGCYVDIKAVTFTGLHSEKYGVNVCGGFTWTLYDE